VEGEEAREEDRVVDPIGTAGVIAQGKTKEKGVELEKEREGPREGGKGGKGVKELGNP